MKLYLNILKVDACYEVTWNVIKLKFWVKYLYS